MAVGPSPSGPRTAATRRATESEVSANGDRIVITAEVEPTPHPHDDFRPKLDHIMREVSDTKITVTKKATAIKLDQQPTLVNNNQQDTFNRAPGVLITEQNTPSQFNISYRGLGNPQESEYVNVLQDGISITSDWIGFPTLYYVPLPQSVSEIQVIRGGSSLLYGPEPAPAINYVSRRPKPGSPFSISTEQIGGADGLYSTFNFLEGTAGPLEYRADFGYVHSDGQRDNSQSDLYQGDLFLGYRPDETQFTYLQFNTYHVSAGNPGRLNLPQYLADRDQTLTPFNHDWVDRVHLRLGHDHEFGPWLVQAQGYFTFLELDTRSTGNLNAAGVPPATTQIQNEDFIQGGLDLRARLKWGRGNALTFGGVVFHGEAPFQQYTFANPAGLSAGRDAVSANVRLNQDRVADYQSFFVENVFRWGKFHAVPSFRLDHENVAIDETVKPGNFARPLAHEDVSRTIPLWGIGLGNDFGKGNETYFSASSGWRPLRYFDVVSPFSPTFRPGNPTDPFKSLDFELGVHGTPITGLWYDVGLFWIDFSNRTETQLLNPAVNNIDTILVNSGESRHRGFEGELSYDLLAPFQRDIAPAFDPKADPKEGVPQSVAPRQHLIVGANLQLLDAEFTDSTTLVAGTNRTLAGNRPAFAPEVVAKWSLTYRIDQRCNISLTGVYVSEQFYQDSNLGTPTLPAKIPSYLVFNLTGEYSITKNVTLLAGITNLGDEDYYSRVFGNALEPAPRRAGYAGLRITF